MNKLQKAFGIGALALSLSGCNDIPPYHVFDFFQKKTVEKKEGNEASLEGMILKVQPSTIPFNSGVRGGNHEFIYVILQESDGKLHTLIYPHSKAILDNISAKIDYEPLKERRIGSEAFIEKLNRDFYTLSNFIIEAEGIIKNIEYKKD